MDMGCAPMADARASHGVATLHREIWRGGRGRGGMRERWVVSMWRSMYRPSSTDGAVVPPSAWGGGTVRSVAHLVLAR